MGALKELEGNRVQVGGGRSGSTRVCSAPAGDTGKLSVLNWLGKSSLVR